LKDSWMAILELGVRAFHHVVAVARLRVEKRRELSLLQRPPDGGLDDAELSGDGVGGEALGVEGDCFPDLIGSQRLVAHGGAGAVEDVLDGGLAAAVGLSHSTSGRSGCVGLDELSME
jgi:hypothetical protein